MTFDPVAFRPYNDPEAYIVGSTDEIWRDRGIGLIRSLYYHPDVVVHSAYGTVAGIKPVVEGTTMRIASYPTRYGKAEDVVWEKRSETSFISSHRVFSTGTHLGWNQYGPATGRDFTMRALAHCLVDRGQITEEWLVRDEYNLVTSLGYDPLEQAAKLAAIGTVKPLALTNVPDKPVLTGVSGDRPDNGTDDCSRILEHFDLSWNQKQLQHVSEFVDASVVLHTSRGRRIHQSGAYTDNIIELLASFPDATVKVIDLCVNDHPRRGRRINAFWLFEGTYNGAPEYGPTTGEKVEFLGSTQHVIEDGVIVEEFRVYDEMALHIQIEQQRIAQRARSAAE